MTDLIAEFAQHLDDNDRAQSTIELYTWLLRRADRELPAGLYAANADELTAFVNGQHTYSGQRRAKASRQLYVCILRSFFTWATDPGRPRLDFDPAGLLPHIRVPDGTPRPTRDDELADILARAADPYRVWIWLAAYAGLRCVEIARLDREDVNAEHLVVFGKGGKQRIVPTHPQLWRVVEPLPAGPIVVDHRGQRATRQHVSKRGGLHIHRMGYPHITMHRARHWFATRAYEATGGDIRATQVLVGHANLSTTQRYVAVSAAAMQRGVAGLPVLAAA